VPVPNHGDYCASGGQDLRRMDPEQRHGVRTGLAGHGRFHAAATRPWAC